MTRINALRDITKSDSFQALSGTLNALAFAAVLIVCSIAVGCSSDKPKPVSSNNQISLSQPATAVAPTPAPVAPPAPKPAKKSAPKKPATVNYTDKATGVTFEYPRRYAIETGDAATSIVLTHPVPMNFVTPGGTALAAVELPETGFANTDFSSAFFSVSVHKDLTADQCTEFAVPQTNSIEDVKASEAKPSNGKPSEEKTSEANVAQAPSPASAESGTPAAPSTEAKTETPSASAQPTQPAAPADSTATANTQKPADQPPAANSQPRDFKALQPRSTEAVSGEGTRQSDSRYFHVYQNGSCYEFALNVTTNANGDGLTKHIDRDKVFARLEKILDTVKLEDLAPATQAITTEAPSPSTPSGSPAQ